MEKRAWTARGQMQVADVEVIRVISEQNPVAARIFVTGEVHESYLGTAATRLLVSINDTLYEHGANQEPLFVETEDNTVRMARFDPRFVWSCIHPDTLIKLIDAESARLGVGVDPRTMDEFDFYEEMAAALRRKVGRAVPIAWKDSDFETYYRSVYLSCLLLYDKPGYMDISVARLFAQPDAAKWLAGVDYRKLELAETDQLDALKNKYAHIQALTNPEVSFIVSLYERNRK